MGKYSWDEFARNVPLVHDKEALKRLIKANVEEAANFSEDQLEGFYTYLEKTGELDKAQNRPGAADVTREPLTELLTKSLYGERDKLWSSKDLAKAEAEKAVRQVQEHKDRLQREDKNPPRPPTNIADMAREVQSGIPLMDRLKAAAIHAPSILHNPATGLLNMGMAAAMPPQTPGGWTGEVAQGALNLIPGMEALVTGKKVAQAGKGLSRLLQASEGAGAVGKGIFNVGQAALPAFLSEYIDQEAGVTSKDPNKLIQNASIGALFGLVGTGTEAGLRSGVKRSPAFVVPAIKAELEKLNPVMHANESAERIDQIWKDVNKAKKATEYGETLEGIEKKRQEALVKQKTFFNRVEKLTEDDTKAFNKTLNFDKEYNDALSAHQTKIGKVQQEAERLENELYFSGQGSRREGMPIQGNPTAAVDPEKQKQLMYAKRELEALKNDPTTADPEKFRVYLGEQRKKSADDLKTARGFLTSVEGELDQLHAERSVVEKSLDAMGVIGNKTGKKIASDPQMRTIFKQTFQDKESGEALVNYIVNKGFSGGEKEEPLKFLEALDSIYGPESKHKQVIQKRFLARVFERPLDSRTDEFAFFTKELDNFGESSINRMFGSEHAYENLKNLSEAIAFNAENSPLKLSRGGNAILGAVSSSVGPTLYLSARFGGGNITPEAAGGQAAAVVGAAAASAFLIPAALQWRGIVNTFLKSNPVISKRLRDLSVSPSTANVSGQAAFKLLQFARQNEKDEQKQIKSMQSDRTRKLSWE